MAQKSEGLISQFLQNLLDEAGMQDVSVEVRDQMLKDLRARLDDRLFGQVVMSLPEENLTEFRKMAESGASQIEMEKYIEKNLPNSQEVFSQAMETFRKDYLGLA